MVPRFDPCGREPDSCAGEGCEEDAAGGAVSTVTDFGVASVPAEAGGAGWTRQSDRGGSDLRPGASSVLPHFYEELSPPRGQQMLSHQGSPRFTGGRKSGRHLVSRCFVGAATFARNLLRHTGGRSSRGSPPHWRQRQQVVAPEWLGMCGQVLCRCGHSCEGLSPPHGQQKCLVGAAILARGLSFARDGLRYSGSRGCRIRVALYVRTCGKGLRFFFLCESGRHLVSRGLPVRPFLRGVVAITRAAEALGRCCHSCEELSPPHGQQRRLACVTGRHLVSRCFVIAAKILRGIVSATRAAEAVAYFWQRGCLRHTGSRCCRLGAAR
jgi:hypothetical protein